MHADCLRTLCSTCDSGTIPEEGGGGAVINLVKCCEPLAGAGCKDCCFMAIMSLFTLASAVAAIRAVQLYYIQYLLLYKDEKPTVCPSICRHFFRHAHNFAVSRRIDSGLARNVSHVFWHLPVCFEKFLITAVCRVRRFVCEGVDDSC